MAKEFDESLNMSNYKWLYQTHVISEVKKRQANLKKRRGKGKWMCFGLNGGFLVWICKKIVVGIDQV